MLEKESESNFCSMLFGENVLKKFLSSDDFEKYIKLMKEAQPFDFQLISSIADALKKWAIEKGATHYTHWFFPLSGKTAGKQVAFAEFDQNGNVIENFDAKDLVKGETDASSFPSGGTRFTFEARGYTIWDYTSPPFLKEDLNGNLVLFLPTAFCSYTSIALDEKTPLLRALEVLSSKAVTLLHKLGYNDVKRVSANLGSEQEYFIIPQKRFLCRKDLVITGRTLLGKEPTKSQVNHGNYFGSIPSDISAFMNDVNKELWKVGIIAKHQHNEVAPMQYEFVAIFREANIACDNNHIVMDTITRVAKKHGFEALLHEKPFKGINGSGKHLNFSVSTDTGINLFDAKHDSKLFLLFFSSMLAAIEKHYKLLRFSAAYNGNDLRLGGDEAPPAIISVFVGDYILDIFKRIEESQKISEKKSELLNIGVKFLPSNYRDVSDRNRTSPFAFTGNKFEFRMVGSSQSLAMPAITLVTILAEQLDDLLNLIENGGDVNEVVLNFIKQNIKAGKRIIFNGDGYSESWLAEAEKRGIENLTDSVSCYELLGKKEEKSVFTKMNVLSDTEINLRQHILLESYCENIKTEACILYDIVNSQILPCLSENLNRFAGKSDYHVTLQQKFLYVLNEIFLSNEKLNKLIEQAKTISSNIERAKHYRDNILSQMKIIRELYDEIEGKVAEDLKPFPNYDDILYMPVSDCK